MTLTFEAARITQAFSEISSRFSSLLAKYGEITEVQTIQLSLEKSLDRYNQEGLLGVAFIGQYSAGKSTVISALTNRRDIKIDANIATDQVSEYLWNGVRIIDTPGLFTERSDHDEITYDAIAKSDLLVFCLTYMLFDEITLANFKKLAFDKQYRWKMVLLVNKMSDEAGDDEEKIKNYRESLATALQGCSLDSFPVFFIDAKDYCEGIDNNDDFLIEISHFENFIDGLNNFIKSRNSLAQLDVPIRIILDAIDDAEIAIKRDNNEDTLFFEILKKFTKAVQLDRNRFVLDTQNIKSELTEKITQIGVNLSYDLTGEDNLMADEQNVLKQNAMKQAQECYQVALENSKLIIEERSNSLYNQIQDIFMGNLVEIFLKRAVNKYDFNEDKESQSFEFSQVISQIQDLQDFGEMFGLNPVEMAQRQGWLNTANLANQAGNLRVLDVYGSQLHHTVRSVGEFFGYNFKLFEAASWAKNIANFSAAFGEVLLVLSIASEIYSFFQESQREAKLAEKRVEIQQHFVTIAADMVKQLNQGLIEVYNRLFIQAEAKISQMQASQKQSSSQAKSDTQELSQIRHELNQLLGEINRSASQV
jgi:GTP-binding protein EngB required for normal cell division